MKLRFTFQMFQNIRYAHASSPLRLLEFLYYPSYQGVSVRDQEAETVTLERISPVKEGCDRSLLLLLFLCSLFMNQEEVHRIYSHLARLTLFRILIRDHSTPLAVSSSSSFSPHSVPPLASLTTQSKSRQCKRQVHFVNLPFHRRSIAVVDAVANRLDLDVNLGFESSGGCFLRICFVNLLSIFDLPLSIFPRTLDLIHDIL